MSLDLLLFHLFDISLVLYPSYSLHCVYCTSQTEQANEKLQSRLEQLQHHAA